MRKGATRIDILPKERRGSLDREKLEKHGLNIDRLIKKDALFMLQLLVPLTDTKKEGGVEYDERMPYYSEVSRFSCLNLTKKCGSADTGRTPKMFFSREEIHFDAIIMANGLAGGEANIDKLWDEGDPKFNPDVKKCKLKPTRFVDVKSFRKYNDNDRGTVRNFCFVLLVIYLLFINIIYKLDKCCYPLSDLFLYFIILKIANRRF